MNVRSLSPLEAKVVLRATSEAKSEVTIDNIQDWLSISRTHSRKLAHVMSRKRWIQRVGRGRYLVNPPSNGPEAIPDRDPFRIGSRLVHPYFFSHSTAANLHGLLKQRFQEYVISTPRRKRVPKNLPIKVRFVVTSARDAKGSEEQERRGTKIRLSDKETTVVDCVDRPDLVGGIANATQIVASAKSSMNWNRLVDAAQRAGRHSTVQRLGWLLKRVRPDLPVPRGAIRRLQTLVGAAYVPLDPAAPRKGPTDPTWHVQLNKPITEVMSEVTIV